MFEYFFAAALFSAAAAAALFAYVAVIGAVQINRKSDIGWFPLIMYVMLCSVALGTLDSGRDLSQGAFSLLVADSVGRSSWGAWSQRLCTIVILVVSVERIGASVFAKNKVLSINLLLILFVSYWACTVASPSLLGRYPNFSYDFIYPLLIGVAGFVLSVKETERAIHATRNAALIFIAAGFLLIPLNAGLVLEIGYSQGYIPGLPRMAGLSPHALQLGLIVQIAMLCLWVYPFERKALNVVSWAMCLLALLLAQSKTAWVSFFLCALVMTLLRSGSIVSKWVFDYKRPSQGVLVMFGWVLAIALLAYVISFSQFGNKLTGFLDTKEGAALLTLNGRDQIWKVAIDEWRESPIWGYGPSFLNSAHRLSLGLPFATHGHNQLIDDLARAGAVGAFAMVIYSMFLLVQSIRTARVSDGLSITLFIVIFIRGISEVPLTMYGYNVEFVAHLLLLIVLHGSSKALVPAPLVRPA